MKESKYLSAKQESRTFSMSQLYTNNSYSSYRILKLKKELLLPLDLQKLISNGRYGFLNENIIWVSKNGLWFYDINENLLEFVGPVEVEAMISFHGEMIGSGVVMICDNNISIYGLENGVLIETEYKFPKKGELRCYDSISSKVFIGYDSGVEMISFNGYGFISNFYSGSGYFFQKRITPQFISGSEDFLVLAEFDKFYIFSSKNSLKLIKNEYIGKYTNKIVTGCGIIESDINFLLFYIILSDNMRLFFILNYFPSFFSSKISLNLAFSKSGPFTDSDESIEFEKNIKRRKFIENSLKIKNIIHKDKIILLRKNKFGFISFNNDQKVNPYSTRSVENFILIPFNHTVKSVYINNSVCILTENFCHIFKILSGAEQFLNCKADEKYKLTKAFGEKETAVNYLNLIADGYEVGSSVVKLINEDALYTYIVRILEPFYGKLENRSVDFFEKIDQTMAGLKNILRFKNIVEINELIQALEYLKILNRYQKNQLYGDFENAILGNGAFKKRTLNALMESNTQEMLKILEDKCSGYFSLGQIYHKRGLEILKNHKNLNSKGYLKESLVYFRKSESDLKPIISIYNENKFFLGSAVLLRKGMPTISEIVKSLGCKGAYITLLEDNREAFVYRVLESALILFKKNNTSFLKTECACCVYKKPQENLTINDIFEIDVPFLESFLKFKFENSGSDFDLLWKYYLFHKKKDEAQNILVRIAEEKPLIISERYTYLNRALYIGEYDEEIKRKSILAKIQMEIQERLQNITINELLDQDDLFNKYTMPFNFYDLSLKIIDISDFDNLEILKSLWSNYLTTDKDTCVENIKKIKISNTSLNVEAIGSALLKVKGNLNIYEMLKNIGFTSNEIFLYFKKMLVSDIELQKKSEILGLIEKYFVGEYEGCKQRCFKYGLV